MPFTALGTCTDCNSPSWACECEENEKKLAEYEEAHPEIFAVRTSRIYKVDRCIDCPDCSLGFCQEMDERIPEKLYNLGIIPDWCPLKVIDDECS